MSCNGGSARDGRRRMGEGAALNNASPLLATDGAHRLIAYYRVSTVRQGRSGLGLEAQREAVARHVRSVGAPDLVAEYREVETGKRDDRPQLAAALAACRVLGCILVIAKLDRLSRNAAFLINLESSGVEFVAADMPHANRLTIHLMAILAQHERELISKRTTEALAAAKARGVVLGGARNPQGYAASARAAAAVRSVQAREWAASVAPYLREAANAGSRTLTALAADMAARGVRTPSGRGRWHATTVRRALVLSGASPIEDTLAPSGEAGRTTG